jgi:NADH-quinone oxidoreductase subunit E
MSRSARRELTLAHGAHTSPNIDLKPLKNILDEHFNPTNYQDGLELIVQACQEAQHLYGYVPHEATRLIADHLGVIENRIYGLLTFYADFLTDPPGKHVILLCHGAACYVMGSQKIVDHLDHRYNVSSGRTTKDGTLTVQIVNGCLGVCDLAPVAQIDHDRYHSHLTVESFEELLESLRQDETPRSDTREEPNDTDEPRGI